jgi:hypothetical protein
MRKPCVFSPDGISRFVCYGSLLSVRRAPGSAAPAGGWRCAAAPVGERPYPIAGRCLENRERRAPWIDQGARGMSRTTCAISAIVILAVAIAISIILDRAWPWLIAGVVVGAIVALWP